MLSQISYTYILFYSVVILPILSYLMNEYASHGSAKPDQIMSDCHQNDYELFITQTKANMYRENEFSG
ncbi:hypothetical protein L6452_38458 [Arctium lappa]|uniref:Uncharacterized protein n=1 Tax=Arctium lappa TaxID=4217 RepID=A0ACB8XQ14_ARCLA|nr:hypothetical protein L6452_38458 [Arctium lappa]